MSNELSALAIPVPRRRTHSNASNTSLPPLSTWSDGRRALSSFSSSPPPSSSPPMTPYSSASHAYPYIRSSPAFGVEITRYTPSDDIDEGSSTWQRHTSKATSQTPLPGIKSLFVDVEPVVHPIRPAAPRSSYTPPQHHTKAANASSSSSKYPSVFVDSEEEQEESDSEGLSFVGTDRSSFFRVSCERGRWRYDPPRPRALTRQSAPTSSSAPIPDLKLASRPISEPAPSTVRVSTPPPPSHTQVENDQTVKVPPVDVDVAVNAVDSLSLLPGDTGTHLEPVSDDEPVLPYVSSPLPPSSPPLSSVPASPIMRSISPLSFAPSSPYLPPSSPLSFCDSLPSDEVVDMDMDVQNGDDAEAPPTLLSKASPEPDLASSPPEDESQAKVPNHSVSATPPSSSPLVQAEPESTSCPSTGSSTEPLAVAESIIDAHSLQGPSPDASLTIEDPGSPMTEFSEEEKTDEPCENVDIADIDIAVISVAKELFADELDCSTPPILCSSSNASVGLVHKGKAKERNGAVGALRTKDENGVKENTLRVKEKRKKLPDDERGTDARPRKKSKSVVASGDGLTASSSGSQEKPKKPKARKEGKRRLEENEEEEENSIPAPKPKKLKKTDVDVSPKHSSRPTTEPSTASSTSTSALKSKSSPHASSSKSDPIRQSAPAPPKDPAAEEILGMVIETMATSRASSMPASLIYKSALLTRPSLSSQRTDAEWLIAIENTLHHGEAKGVFGKVESSFKDEDGKPLEAQWFYVPEGDEDQERATLVRSMMPRAGKRSETKKYKQYYWRPLAKISRWDPEDDL